jgi:O-antigen/teichoic acid export membrane protein
MSTTQDVSPTQGYVSYVKNVGFVAATTIAINLLGFITLPILTKWLGVYLYGTWSLIQVTVTLITSLATLGLPLATLRFLASEKDTAKIREGFLSAALAILIAGTVLSVILILLSDFLASSIFGDISSSHFIKLAAFMILTEALSQMALIFFRTFRQMKTYSALLFSKAAIQLGLIVGFLLLGWALDGVIIGSLVGGALVASISIFLALRRTGFQFPKFTELKDYLRFGVPLIPNIAILWVILFSDRYMIGYFLGTSDVGIYAAAYGLASLVSFYAGPLNMVLYPTVSKLYDEGKIAETKTYLKYSLKYLMMLSIPSAFGLSILALPLLQTLTTPEFTSGNTIVPILAAGLVAYGFYQLGLYTIRLVKKTYLEAYILGISAALNIGLNFLLIPRIGILGAAVATLVAYGVLGILTIIVSFRYLKFDLGIPFLMKSLLASAVMLPCINLLHPAGAAKIVISAIIGVVVYFIVLFLLKGFDKSEMVLVKDIVLSYRSTDTK